jgi:hypothetical protein
MTGLSSCPLHDGSARTLTGMTTQYAARRVVLEGNDSEPEGLASSWGDSPAPRRAIQPEAPATSYAMYEPAPELVPFTSVTLHELPTQQASSSEDGAPVVALAPSQTMAWHLTAESMAPHDPGPANATTPLTAGDPTVDPASIPTPVSHVAAFEYQSMPSPSPYTSVTGPSPYPSLLSPPPYASMPAQGSLDAPVASPYGVPMAAPYTMPTASPSTSTIPALDAVEAIGVKALTIAVIVQRVVALAIVLSIVAVFTVVGFSAGGSNTWFIVGFSWLVGVMMILGVLTSGRGRLRMSALK